MKLIYSDVAKPRKELLRFRGLKVYTHVVPLTVIAFAAACLAEGPTTADSATAHAVVKEQGFLPFAHAPINYRSAPLRDPIAKLEKRLERGEVVLQYESSHGYLKAVLDALRVPVSSQTLVFSKTSFQFPEITPATPRALYYNDDVYVGQVQKGKFLEFVSFDPMQGAIFYVMDEHESTYPRFERAEIDCVQCHVAASTKGVPGVMLRSVFTRPSGYEISGKPSFVTGQESPIDQRWGGWYVTAAQGLQQHMGNVTLARSNQPEQPTGASPATLPSLAGLINTSAYLTDSSDVVALLVLAHQTQMHNLITEVNYKTRLALHAEATRTGASNVPADSIPEEFRNQFEGPAEQLVRYLLFTNEVPLSGPVLGTSDFAADFAKRGPRDSLGRSLRDFDLRTRIFKYPCSYLIYSETFDAIPEPAKGYIYSRLFDVLSSRDQSPEFASLSNASRRAILEILASTKPGMPEEWRQFVQSTSEKNYGRVPLDTVSRQR